MLSQKLVFRKSKNFTSSNGIQPKAPATPGAPTVEASDTPLPDSTPISVRPTASPIRMPTELREITFGVDGDERRVRVYLPDPVPTRKVPLVVFLHASGETPATAIRDTGFDQLAGRDGFIVAFPPAADGTWNAQVTPGLSDSAIDERYLGGLLDRLIEDLPVDGQRVYVTGFSMGAVMTDRLACRFADRIAAVAIVSGAPWTGGTCSPSQPVSVLIMHGTGDSTFRYATARRLGDAWLTLDGCPPPAAPQPIGNGATVVRATGCADGSAVTFVTVENGWHTWFSSPDATSLAWQFFTEHGRR